MRISAGSFFIYLSIGKHFVFFFQEDTLQNEICRSKWIFFIFLVAYFECKKRKSRHFLRVPFLQIGRKMLKSDCRKTNFAVECIFVFGIFVSRRVFVAHSPEN